MPMLGTAFKLGKSQAGGGDTSILPLSGMSYWVAGQETLNAGATSAGFLEQVATWGNGATTPATSDATQATAGNRPIAMPLIDGKPYLYCSGQTGNYAVTQGRPEFDITGDVVVTIQLKHGGASGRQTLISAGIDYLELNVNSDGLTPRLSIGGTTGTSTAAMSGSENYLRATWNHSSGDMAFYTSSDGESFSQLGGTVSTAETGDTTESGPFYIGCREGGTNLFYGAIVSAKLSIGGTEVLDSSPATTDHAATDWVSASGHFFQISQSGNNPAFLVGRPVIYFDGSDNYLSGTFDSTLGSIHMFAVYTIAGDGGEADGRIFSVAESTGADTDADGAILGKKNTTALDVSFGTSGTLSHSGGLTGRILHEVIMSDGEQISRLNGGIEDSDTASLSLALDRFSIGGKASDGTVNAAIFLEEIVIFESLTPPQSISLQNTIAGDLGVSLDSDDLAITSPSSYQVFQRNGSNVADISITGTYSGSPTSIEARWDGGSWLTIDASPSAGNFSGTLSNQSTGQGNLDVRVNSSRAYKRVPFVGVGEVFLCIGQSNMSGRGTNNFGFKATGYRPSNFGNNYEWAPLLDPYDSDTDQVDTVSSDASASGSWVVLLGGLLSDSQGCPVAFIPASLGGTSITDWQPGMDHMDRTTLYGSAVYRADLLGGVRAALWWQGENDAQGGMIQSTYNSNLDVLADTLASDLSITTMACLLMDTTISDAGEAIIRAATTEAVGDNSNVTAGPDFSDITSDDAYHANTSAKLQTIASRWVTAIESEYF